MITQECKEKILCVLQSLSRHECADMFERYQILAEHIYPILVADKRLGFSVDDIHKELVEQEIEEFNGCGLMSDDVLFALAFLTVSLRGLTIGLLGFCRRRSCSPLFSLVF